MLRRLLSVGTLLGLSICLNGCSNKEVSIIGLWEDPSGYMINFQEGKTFTESLYNIPLTYNYTDNILLYYWPDGLQRVIEVDLKPKTLSLHINGEDRVFTRSKSYIKGYDWKQNSIPTTATIVKKFSLTSDAGIESVLSLYSTRQYELTYKSTLEEDTEEISSDKGLYADGGPKNNLVLYSGEGHTCATFYENSTGNLLGAHKLDGVLDSIESDYSSPVNWRGYRISGIVSDDSTKSTYTFSLDNKVIRKAVDGSTITYAYYTDTEGCIYMSALNGQIETDTMLLDVDNLTVYRMLYRSDKWTDYVYTTSTVSSASSQALLNEGFENVPYSYGLLDGYSVINSEDSLVSYPVPIDFKSLTVLSKFSENDDAQFYNNIHTLENQLSSLEEIDKQRMNDQTYQESEVEFFLDQMFDLVRDKEIAELEYRQQKEEQELIDSVSGTSTPEGTTSNNIVGVTDTTGATSPVTGQKTEDSNSSNSATGTPTYNDIPSNFGSNQNGEVPTITPSQETITVERDESGKEVTVYRSGDIVTEVNDSDIYFVHFYCNCDQCHQDSYPVQQGENAVAIVDSREITEGVDIILTPRGSNNATPINAVTKDSAGYLTGKYIDVYFVDHNFVSNLESGHYNVLKTFG